MGVYTSLYSIYRFCIAIRNKNDLFAHLLTLFHNPNWVAEPTFKDADEELDSEIHFLISIFNTLASLI